MNNNINKSRTFKKDKYEATSSILSDYSELDGYEVINDGDDQSLYVLFNPVKKVSAKAESDILSTNTLTNTQTRLAEPVEEDDEDEDEEEDELHSLHPDRQIKKQRLSFKIDSWHESNFSSAIIEDDNVASWNLDENLISDNLYQDGSNLYEGGAYGNGDPFYGDDLLAHLNKEELAKFKRFHQMYDIKLYLLKEGTSSPTSQTRKQRLIQLLDHTLLEESLSGLKRGAYIGHLKRAVSSATLARERSLLAHHIEKSKTPSAFSEGSSLVMCGGGGSWNDI